MRFARSFLLLLGITVITFLVSCSDSDSYIDAIPKRSPAVMSINVMKHSGTENNLLLRLMFHIKNMKGTGIDLTKNIYVFESPDGFYGFCAAISDASDFADMVAKRGFSITDYRKCKFCMMGTSWLAGFTDDVLLVMGPISMGDRHNLMQVMAGYLKQDREKGLRSSRLFGRLDMLDGPLSIVSRLQSFPEKMALPLMLGAPDGIGTDLLYYAGNITTDKDAIYMEGELFSFNKAVNNRLKKVNNLLKPISGQLIPDVSENNIATIFLNAENYLAVLMQNNAVTREFMIGANTLIDMNKIMGEFKGEVAIGIPMNVEKGDVLQFLAANCGNAWVADVDKWRHNMPQGMTINKIGNSKWICTGNKSSYIFGLMPNKTFYFGTDSFPPSSYNGYKEAINGKRIGVMLNLHQLLQVKDFPMCSELQTLIGARQYLVYTLR